jgi:single-strand DNA-binding protein
MNFITIAGQLGRDAEVRYLNSGDPVCSFSVADSAGRDKPTIWWNCSIFGKRAEALSPYLLKGQAVTVCGAISERAWKDKDGNDRKSMDVRVSEVALQGGKKAAGGSQERSSGGGGGDDDIPFTPLAPGKSWAVV